MTGECTPMRLAASWTGRCNGEGKLRIMCKTFVNYPSHRYHLCCLFVVVVFDVRRKHVQEIEGFSCHSSGSGSPVLVYSKRSFLLRVLRRICGVVLVKRTATRESDVASSFLARARSQQIWGCPYECGTFNSAYSVLAGSETKEVAWFVCQLRVAVINEPCKNKSIILLRVGHVNEKLGGQDANIALIVGSIVITDFKLRTRLPRGKKGNVNMNIYDNEQGAKVNWT